jgi:uncharacterized protein (TIGR00266 family)
MKTVIEGKPAFSFLKVELEPNETIIAESDAMSSMASELDMSAKFNGGLFIGLVKKYLGNESLFVNEFTNNTASTKTLTLVQATPGDIMIKELKEGDIYYLQPGSFLASEKGVKIDISWAGIGSFIGGEGLFRLKASGSGKLIFGAYGGLVEKEIDGDYIVDTGHLVSYDPSITINIQLAGGVVSSLMSGEGIVMRLNGKGKIVMQTRNLGSLVTWINRQL